MGIKLVSPKAKIIIYCLLAFVVLACQNAPGYPNGKGKIGNTINVSLSVDEFELKTHDTSGVQLIDVRTPEEFAQGHLVGALNFNFNSDGFENQINELKKEKPVLLYCLSGGRSSSAAHLLEEKGFTTIYNLQGGIMKYNAANKSIVIGSAMDHPGLSMVDFKKLLQSSNYVLVDFNAKWCAPCQRMKPMLASFIGTRKNKLTFHSVPFR